MEFSHLHVHTQYSLLDGAASISNLLAKARNNGMKALAISDHGNMFGVPRFVSEAKKADVKPIVGCEFYLARGSRFDKTKATESDEKSIYHQILLAKNQQGYKNLSLLCTRGFTEGYYYKPRIDKELIREHREGLIATTCCLASEINQAILRKGEDAAEKIFLEWLDIFGDDYYVELQRHGIADQDRCNEVLLKWARKHNVKVIATNDVHYVERQDSEAQDILLCLQTGKDFQDPNRMRFDGKEFFLKTPQEMEVLFKDLPEALENTQHIVDKVEAPKITRDILLPIYALPEGFTSELDYLRHISFEGARRRFGSIGSEVEERINFELKVIGDMGFAGYFLIVQDFTTAARNLNVSVGPGRGSAAGSLVAYCIGITNIDPIRYDLLFERFLNPERVSMPDIDIDFDEDGRAKVIDYVVEKYGRDRVAQIVTFGTMAAKSSIKDVARVLGLPLSEADRLSKLVPEGVGVNLKKAFEDVKELAEERRSQNPLIAKTLQFAEILEGSARHTGIHAAGVIIAPDKLEGYIPLCTAKDADLLVTQYDGKYVESAGMLKMDFLGLKTLNVISDTLKTLRQTRGIEVNIDEIPLDDATTFALYQRGDTIGTFQFESEGMQLYLRDLKPTNIEDLIAMNALYRPGPLQFIPQFINRKQGRETVEYPHPILEPILKHTYGIMVYQEQIMQTAQIMGGFTLGGADLLRRAMGKKDAKTMEAQKEVFVKGAGEKGIDAGKAAEVFEVMQKFAEYGFNRSHSAAYSILAYQTGFLKANYPAEYMAAVLTRNMGEIKKITFFMDECRKQGIAVLGPDVNESEYTFTVNTRGQIRFGLGAVKGVGEGAVAAIIDERKANGPYTSIFNLTSRINLRAANKRCLESLAFSGAFDAFDGVHRAQYFHREENENENLLERAVRYGAALQDAQNATQINLFGEVEESIIPEPIIPACAKWNKLQQLKFEKEVIGFYLSGHPLDLYKLEMTAFCRQRISDVKDRELLAKYHGREVIFAGLVAAVAHKTGQNGSGYGSLTLEDYEDTITLNLFSESYLKFRHLLIPEAFLFVRARVEPRYKQPDQLELRVSHVQLLADVREKFTSGLQLSLSLEELDEVQVNRLVEVLQRHPGKCPVKVSVVERKSGLKVDMRSRRHQVSVSGELMEALRTLDQVRVDLLTGSMA